ncbi:MAG TPA: FAD-dependent oxidoreductase [Pseudonocardiaceae bacterium]|jgi:2-polyprenyl-6-methoxyphenol hydroxylase-like FAD-dependent oxidoreductase|nr:FAD-dependent oxidoreductase [Pseudonocardiaceae bacterium]
MKVIVIGGSVVGLGAALALADHGNEVLILDRETEAAPANLAAAGSDWSRPTVPQGVHSHAFASLGCNLLRDRAPDVHKALLDAGSSEVRLTDFTPPMLGKFETQPGDEELRMLTCRRAVFEWALRQRTLAREKVSLRAGATVRGLLRSSTEANRVTGVRLDDGSTIEADVVIDASGRRSNADEWLAAANLPVPEANSESCKIVYYTRYYRRLRPQPAGPLNRGFGAGGLWNHYTAVLFLGDKDTFSISIGVLPEDKAMKELRHEAAFTAAIAATPLLAGWVAEGNSEPISPVYAMGGLDNSLRLPSTERANATIGFFGIGDAVCTTNPAYGRGVSLGLSHAFALADLLAEHPTVDVEQAVRFARETEALVRPWFEESLANDRGRAGLWQATLNQQPPMMPPAGMVTFGTAVAASTADPVVWRQVAKVMMMLAQPPSLYADPDIKERVGKALRGGPPPQLPGASREDLVAAVSAATAAPVGA